ncbi:MAG: PilZ domain-containing protein [Spirochaetales bacterium]|jgi:c-di-GMP-binding flagellar brake protein YcgR|nr:PilZ domain-containing protein [Spirochaetales bacterium]
MSPQDQRQTTRVDSLNLSYFCVDEEQNIITQGMGRTLNISITGILLETNEVIPEGKTVDMEIAMKNDIISASGLVAHSTKEKDDIYHTGIQFTKLSDEDKETISKFI